ncbi:MAG: NAD(P)H-dependent oxidoreductase [Bdellovibrio sp.]|nr:NAD(P)H-dependent oxidoreductase [Bdellovibrio sp.]
MKYIIAGTDRPGSNTLKLSKFIQGLYKAQGEDVEIIDLAQVKEQLHSGGPHYGKTHEGLQVYLDKVVHSEGLIVVCPEYNGSMPGALKYFIDHMKFPDSFEFRPVCFVGLSAGMFGGLRPVEHLQQIFGYRNAFIYPERVFIMNAGKVLNAEGEPQDEMIKQLLTKQTMGFRNFVQALSAFKLDANSVIASKK